MKTKVSFVITNPIRFTAEEDYSPLGIEVSVIDGKLDAVRTIVDHHIEAGQEEIIAKARSCITPLLTLVEFGYGMPVVIKEVQTYAIDPESSVSLGIGFIRMDATLVRQIPMPPARLVGSLTETARLAMEWYLVAEKSTSPIERIRNYYKVLEQENFLTGKAPPDEAKRIRDAVSHPHLRNPDVLNYLQQNIGATRIDPKDEAHMQFLNEKARYIQSLAKDIVEARVPKWW